MLLRYQNIYMMPYQINHQNGKGYWDKVNDSTFHIKAGYVTILGFGNLTIFKLINHYDLSISNDKLPAGGSGGSIEASQWPAITIQQPTSLFLTTRRGPDSVLSVVCRFGLCTRCRYQVPGVALGGIHSNDHHRAHSQGLFPVSFFKRCLQGTQYSKQT